MYLAATTGLARAIIKDRHAQAEQHRLARASRVSHRDQDFAHRAEPRSHTPRRPTSRTDESALRPGVLGSVLRESCSKGGGEGGLAYRSWVNVWRWLAGNGPVNTCLSRPGHQTTNSSI